MSDGDTEGGPRPVVQVRADLESLRAMLSAMPVALLVVDEAGRVVRASAAAERLLGRAVAGLVPGPVGDLLGCVHRHGDPRGCGFAERCASCGLGRPVRSAIRLGEGARDLEAEVETGAGDRRWFLVSVEPLGHEGRRFAVAALHEITDRKRALEALAESEARARAMYERLPMPTFVWDHGADGFVLAGLNESADTLTRGGARLWLGRRLDEVYADAPDIVADIGRAYAEKTSFTREMEYRYRTIDVVRQLRVTFGHVPPSSVLVHTEDVTEQRRTEAQLRLAQKMEAVGRLAAGVAHDFNNLLGAILSHAGFALDSLDDADPARGDVEQVRKSADRAAGLTRQLLAFGRERPLAPEAVSLDRLVEGLEPMLRRLLGTDVAVVVRLAEQLATVEADPGQIEQVVVNLAVNARDAMPAGGTLAIETADVELDEGRAAELGLGAPGSYVMLSVSDTGEGMDAETLERVFEPFFTTKDRGSGLGLATVYGIVRRSGGTVHVRSEPGRGSTFEVYLPRAARPADASPRATETMQTPDRETLLVVEDDPSVRSVVVRMLRAAGYRVLTAEGGEEALRLADGQAGRIDLLLTDVVMPGMCGLALAERLAGFSPGLKVVFMSGHSDEAIARHGALEPGARIVAKPFSSAELARAVREALDGPS